MTKYEFIRNTAPYFRGAFELISDKLPDGAWVQVHIDLADNMLLGLHDATGIRKPVDVSGYDVAMSYLESISK